MPQRGFDSQNVTLKTIAEELGVSLSTVARSLKDGHKISPATIAKVRETADRLGYVRNLDGVKLRTGQTFVLMALLGTTNEEEIGDAGSVGLLNGLHSRLTHTQYSLRTVPITIGDGGMDAVLEIVKGRNADGLVLDHTEPDDPRVRFLLEQGVPFVTFGRTKMRKDHAYLDVDNEYAAKQGTDALINAGHRKIAFLDADERFAFVQQRLAGYRASLREAGIPFDASLVRHIAMEADVAKREAIDLVRCGVDGFVCVNELVFLGARAGVRQVRKGNISKTGFSVRTGTNLGEYIGTPMFASYQSRKEAGWTLADLLLKRIEGRPPKDCQLTFRTRLCKYGGWCHSS